MPSGVNYAEDKDDAQYEFINENEKQLLMINKINFLKSERITVTCAYYL